MDQDQKYDITNPKNLHFNIWVLKKMYSTIAKNRNEEINRFRNCDITQHLTSVDIEEIVRSGGYNAKILEGLVCDNLEFNPFERFFYRNDR